MAPRANWNGYLKLSLVSCAIALYPASSTSTRISFNTINRKTGNKVRRIYIDPTTGEEVTGEDQVKGYAVSKNSFVLIEDEDLDALKIESSHAIDIGTFVPRNQIDPRYMDVPLLHHSERQGRAGGLRRHPRSDARCRRRRDRPRRDFEARTHHHARAFRARHAWGPVLRFGYEVRNAADYFTSIPEIALPEEMKGLAHVIIDRRAGTFDPTEFTDRYEDAVVGMVRAKQAGLPEQSPSATPSPSNVIDLMEALRRSIGGEPKAEKKPKPEASTVPAKKAEPSKSKTSVEPEKKAAKGKGKK